MSTGFGALAKVQMPTEKRQQLQRSLIRSHAAGSGPEVEREVVRALMLLRLNTLASGRTGVRPIVAETYAAILNAGITPVVHPASRRGSGSHLVGGLAGADGLARVPAEITQVRAGDEIAVLEATR